MPGISVHLCAQCLFPLDDQRFAVGAQSCQSWGDYFEPRVLEDFPEHHAPDCWRVWTNIINCLVVTGTSILWLSISYMGCHPSQLTYSIIFFFRGVGFFTTNQSNIQKFMGWTWMNINLIELDYGKNYRKALYLMVKTMFSCRFSLNPIQWQSQLWNAVKTQGIRPGFLLTP